jgi:hypothetical protein
MCKGGFPEAEIMEPQSLASRLGAPLLLVGLSKSYRPDYSQPDLSEMARMYWSLDKLKGFPALRDSDLAVIAGWVSDLGGPQIVGIWRIEKGSFGLSSREGSNRYGCKVRDDLGLRRSCVGLRLPGAGQHYQGPHIYLAN